MAASLAALGFGAEVAALFVIMAFLPGAENLADELLGCLWQQAGVHAGQLVRAAS